MRTTFAVASDLDDLGTRYRETATCSTWSPATAPTRPSCSRSCALVLVFSTALRVRRDGTTGLRSTSRACAPGIAAAAAYERRREQPVDVSAAHLCAPASRGGVVSLRAASAAPALLAALE